MGVVPLRSRGTERAEELLRVLERDSRIRITRGPADEAAITIEVPDVDDADESKRLVDAALRDADPGWGDYLAWERPE